MEFKHDEKNTWEACGLDKVELKRCSRRLEDIIDDLEEETRKTSRLVQEIEKEALKDKVFFRYMLVKTITELKSSKSSATVVGVPGSSKLLEAILSGSEFSLEKLGEGLGECDCDDCREMRKRLKSKNEGDEEFNKH